MFLTKAVVQRCSVKKIFLEISQNSEENTNVSLFFNKVATHTFFTEHFWFFLVHFAKFLRTLLVIEYLWWLLLFFRVFVIRIRKNPKETCMEIKCFTFFEIT